MKQASAKLVANLWLQRQSASGPRLTTDGSIDEVVEVRLHRCLTLMIEKSKVSSHRSTPTSPKKVGHMLYMFAGKGVNRSDMVAEYTVSIHWAGDHGKLDIQVTTPDRGEKKASFKFKGSDRIDDLADKYAKVIDVLGNL